MSNIIQIKRSHTTNAPANLGDGELAMSHLSRILYVGDGSSVRAIGGEGAFIRKGGDTITGDLVIQGNLVVKGAQSTVESNTVAIGDAVIELNQDIAADATPSENAGFAIKRGAEADVFWIWDEANDVFTGKVGDAPASIAGMENIALSGTLSAFDAALDTTLNVGTDLTVGGNSVVSGTGRYNGRLTTTAGITNTGASSFNGTFTQTGGVFSTRGIRDGATTKQIDVTNSLTQVNNDVNVSGAITVGEEFSFLSGGSVAGAATFESTVDVMNLRLDGNTVSSTNDNGDISLTPNGTGRVIVGNLDANGGTIDGTVIGAASPAAITGTKITATDIFATRGITDNATAKKLVINDATTTINNDLSVGGSSSVTGALSVGEDVTFSKSLSVGMTLSVDAASTLTGRVTLGENLVGAGTSSSAIQGFTIDGGTF
ncbi:hypothetical protein TW86_04055 [Halomonas sp. S2151]|uniref:hypothetical protein n=1 Tax=Halomonas sp. S2151 TaxID=579478 RepID=UPI0005FA076E|nr:hypothetical protein [Halomonas sp. S2151]KJZ17433.1 hypothetical protein TW86_04055 [Halomonas sp. S2151]